MAEALVRSSYTIMIQTAVRRLRSLNLDSPIKKLTMSPVYSQRQNVIILVGRYEVFLQAVS